MKAIRYWCWWTGLGLWGTLWWCGCGGDGAKPTLTIRPNQASVEIESTLEFKAEVRDAEGILIPDAPITWSLIPPEGLEPELVPSRFGEIDANGKFTAGTEPGLEGQVVATAPKHGLTATAAVKLVRPVDRVEIDPPQAIVNIGRTVTFTARAYDFTGEEIPDIKPTWKLSNNVGTITPEGVFTGKIPGTGKVIAQVGHAKGEAKVTVVGEIKELVVEPNPTSVEVGTARQFRAFGVDQAGNRIPVEATWKVEGNIGTVDDTGLFTAGHTPGEGEIIARMGGKEARAQVAVVEIQQPPGSPANLTGQVSAPNGDPLSEVQITALANGITVATTKTDVEGRYELWLPAGTFTLQATKPGFQTAEQTVTLETQNLRLTGVNFTLTVG
ncbi:MAG TPA: carboxypeptidase regulatory-like domain-containing protein [Armatimonadetes bacterium]|nr:carboxypeptidase regulatory-like domain-containing protein [Armatimonadota bacterium]